MHPDTISLTLSSRIEWIDAVDSVVEDLARLAGFDETTRHGIVLAVREAMNNAVTHGNKSDASKTISVDFQLDTRALCVRIKDQGRGFDVSEIPDPTLRENLLKPSGRGVHLIRSLMDEVDLSRAGRSGGELVMTKRVPESEPEPNDEER
jgi:serine/threonine-protein kinase RsbW